MLGQPEQGVEAYDEGGRRAGLAADRSGAEPGRRVAIVLAPADPAALDGLAGAGALADLIDGIGRGVRVAFTAGVTASVGILLTGGVLLRVALASADTGVRLVVRQPSRRRRRRCGPGCVVAGEVRRTGRARRLIGVAVIIRVVGLRGAGGGEAVVMRCIQVTDTRRRKSRLCRQRPG